MSVSQEEFSSKKIVIDQEASNSITTEADWKFAREIEQLAESHSPFDFNEGYRELQKYNVRVSVDPSPQEILEKLSIVQQYRDRVTEMLIVANNVLGMCKRSYEQAFDSQILNRQEKTQGLREVAVKNLFRPQYNLACKAEEYFENCKMVLNNLKSKQDTLSRQITILQLQQDISGIRYQSLNSPQKPLDSLDKFNALRKPRSIELNEEE